MKTLTLFKNIKASTVVYSPLGFPLTFADGKYYTTNKKHEEYLQELAELGDCGVYIDPEEPTIESDTTLIVTGSTIPRDQTVVNKAPRVSPGNSLQDILQKSAQNTTGIASVSGHPTLGPVVTVSGDQGIESPAVGVAAGTPSGVQVKK